MKRILKKILKIYCILLVIGIVAFFSVGNFVFSFTLLRDSVFSPESLSSLFSQKDNNSSQTSNEKNWLEKNSTELYISSDDGLVLHSLFVKNEEKDNRYAIVCHGYKSRAAYMSYFAKNIYDLGFSVLCPDARAHGESQGNVRGMGYTEKRDIILWINEILKIDSDAQILLYGVSMGGATVLMTSGESDLSSSVKAVVSDCAYTRVYDVVGTQVTAYTSLAPFPIVDAASVVSEMRGNYSFRDASCVDAVKRSVTPTLFIHGSADTFVPFYMLDILYNAASCEKEKLVVDGAAHYKSATTDPQLYWSTVENFVSDKFN